MSNNRCKGRRLASPARSEVSYPGRADLDVTGFETGGDPIVQRSQFIERFNEAGQLENRILQYMEFEMIEESTFREMAIETGFEVNVVFGDYAGRHFEAESSPVMIWELEKHEA